MQLTDQINPDASTLTYTGSKNTDSIFTKISDTYLKLVGSEKSLIGLSDFETPCATSEHAQFFFDQDRMVENSKKSLLCLDVHYYANSLSATFFRKKPKFSGKRL